LRWGTEGAPLRARSRIRGRTPDLHADARRGRETVDQWIALDEIGGQFGLGFFWSEPVPVDELVELLAHDTRPATGAD